MDFVPIEIVGVVPEEVGSPRNDGGPGSALYSVPIRLSRKVLPDEAEMLRHLWDNPPSFTTMHRPGIASVWGDRFVLDGTTIDEVAQVHAHTLRLVVDDLNRRLSVLRREETARAEDARLAEAAHRKAVEEGASAIRFD